MTFGEKVTGFYEQLNFQGTLPSGIQVMNPYRESPAVLSLIRKFNDIFYGDANNRIIILGINPGRLGAGTTGIPFTDTKRLEDKCGIRLENCQTHEPSSVFVYDVIDAFGGVHAFYDKFYIGAVSPLGFTTAGKNGGTVNFNYYDRRDLMEATRQFILTGIRKQIEFGINREICFCLGKGKNERYLNALNAVYGFFKKIVALEHPRYIMQYRAKERYAYRDKYVTAFQQAIKTCMPT